MKYLLNTRKIRLLSFKTNIKETHSKNRDDTESATNLCNYIQKEQVSPLFSNCRGSPIIILLDTKSLENFRAMSANMRHMYISSLRKPFIRGICNSYDCASLSNVEENDLKNYYPVLRVGTGGNFQPLPEPFYLY